MSPKLTLPGATLIIVMISGCLRSYAQQPAADPAAVYNAVQLYHKALNPETGLYNGSQYLDYTFKLKEGIPFFRSATFTEGAIMYDGVLYEKVPMLLDLVIGSVIIKDPAAIFWIQLINEKVSWFTIGENSFVKIVADSLSGNSIMRTGFYQELYKGKLTMLKRHTKTVQEKIDQLDGVQRYIDDSRSYYIKKDEQYYAVNSKATLLKVLKDKKSEISQYIRKQKLDLRNDKDHAFAAVAAYYDGLVSGAVQP
ncbi:hypothetical protein [Sediminibacterium ginsengisoli]|uniref:Uncharacterized protein n=1 Tax=Sediminibacterium ginsengisoli TaxID=413434 RepID=A0A1T4RBZ7_9BACT|nr:hypothetical protein [Sediminibacterium ginsengisoli]SKA13570.1 hypothetical protein SAMN04488132_111113 [Sediminibacterium ginsengisoli]